MGKVKKEIKRQGKEREKNELRGIRGILGQPGITDNEARKRINAFRKKLGTWTGKPYKVPRGLK